MAKAIIEIEDTADRGLSITLKHSPPGDEPTKAQRIASDLVEMMRRIGADAIAATSPRKTSPLMSRKESTMAADETGLEKWLNADHIRLHAGEMTAQELRTVQAVVRAMLAELRTAGVDASEQPSSEETPAEEALRAIACWLGVGGYNATTVDADAFKRKIMEGVSMLAEGAPDALRYRWLRVRGAAFAGDPKRHLEEGLVYRIGNLDDAIDREMSIGADGVKASPEPQGEKR